MAARVRNRVADKAFQLAKPTSIKATDPMPADLLERLQVTFLFSDTIMSELKRHTSAHSEYPDALRGDMLRGLWILSQQLLSPDHKTAIANQLIEGAPMCTPGFHNRVNELVMGLANPKNLAECLYQMRGDLVRRAARTLSDDVHVNNSFFRVACQRGYGVEPINNYDDHRGVVSDEVISRALQTTFRSDFQYVDVLVFLSKMAKGLLSTQAGYSGRLSAGREYKGEHIHQFEAVLMRAPFELPGRVGDFMVCDEETSAVYDLKWNHIHHLLFNKLCDGHFFVLSHETIAIIRQLFEEEDKVLSVDACQPLFELDLKHVVQMISLLDGTHHQKVVSLTDSFMTWHPDPDDRLSFLAETLKDQLENKALIAKIVEKHTLFIQDYARGMTNEGLMKKIETQAFNVIDSVALGLISSEHQIALFMPNDCGQNAIMMAAIKAPAVLEVLLSTLNKMNTDTVTAIMSQLSQVAVKPFNRIFEAMISFSTAHIMKDFLSLYLSIHQGTIIEHMGNKLVEMHEKGYPLSEQEALTTLYLNQLRGLSFEDRMLIYCVMLHQVPPSQASLLELIHDAFKPDVAMFTFKRLLGLLNTVSNQANITHMIIEHIPGAWVNAQDERGHSLLMRMATTQNVNGFSALLKRSELDVSLEDAEGANVFTHVGGCFLCTPQNNTPEQLLIFKTLLAYVKTLGPEVERSLLQFITTPVHYFMNVLQLSIWALNEKDDDLSSVWIKQATLAQLNDSDNSGNRTVLHFALYNHRAKVAMQLLERGVDVNVKNINGNTALHVLFMGITGFNDLDFKALAEALIHRKDADFSLLNHHGLSVLKVAVNALADIDRKTNTGQILDDIIMEMVLKISVLSFGVQRQILRDMPDGPYSSGLSFLFSRSLKAPSLLLKRFHESQLIAHLARSACLAEMSNKNRNGALISWFWQIKELMRYPFTTPFTLNLTGCFLKGSLLSFQGGLYDSCYIPKYLELWVPEKVIALNVSGNDLHRESRHRLYHCVLCCIPSTVERVALNRAIFLDRLTLLSLFKKNNFYKTLRAMSVEDGVLYCEGLKENLSQFIEGNATFAKDVSRLPSEKRDVVLKAFDSPLLNAMVSSTKQLLDLGHDLQTAAAVDIDRLMNVSIPWCQANALPVLLQFFKNPRMDFNALDYRCGMRLLSFIQSLLNDQATDHRDTLDTFLEQMHDPSSVLFRYFHEKKLSIVATMYCREIEILRLEGSAFKGMMQVERKRQAFRSLFQGGDFYKTLKDFTRTDVILICNVLLPHLDIIFKVNPKIGNQLTVLFEKNPECARAVLESFDSPVLNALVHYQPRLRFFRTERSAIQENFVEHTQEIKRSDLMWG